MACLLPPPTTRHPPPILRGVPAVVLVSFKNAGQVDDASPTPACPATLPTVPRTLPNLTRQPPRTKSPSCRDQRGDNPMPRQSAGGCREFSQLEALSRRDFLRVGALSALGLTLPNLLAAEARASDYTGERPTARARSCILLF